MKKQFLLSLILLGFVCAQNIAAASNSSSNSSRGSFTSSLTSVVTSDAAKTMAKQAAIVSGLALVTNYGLKYAKKAFPTSKYLEKINPKKAAMAVVSVYAIITGAKAWRSKSKASKVPVTPVSDEVLD